VLASTLTLQARARLKLDEPDSAESLLLRVLTIHGAAADNGEAAALAESLLADARARQSRS
jgi:N-acetylglutamate synthase-like GNAT family acetyltransferase